MVLLNNYSVIMIPH